MAKNIATKSNTEVVVPDDLYADDTYQSGDELSADSYAVPRLVLLEKMSPQVDESEGDYIPEAKPGMLFNSVTGDLYAPEDGVTVIPCLRKHVFIEWVPRNAGGGFAGLYSYAEGATMMKTTERNDKGMDELPNGNELHETMEFYVLFKGKDDDALSPAVISMSRTRMKEAKRWNFRIDNRMVNGRKVKDVAQVYPLTSAIRKGEEGNSYVWKAGDADMINVVFPEDYTSIMQMAMDFKAAVSAGERGTDYNEDTKASEEPVEEF